MGGREKRGRREVGRRESQAEHRIKYTILFTKHRITESIFAAVKVSTMHGSYFLPNDV